MFGDLLLIFSFTTNTKGIQYNEQTKEYILNEMTVHKTFNSIHMKSEKTELFFIIKTISMYCIIMREK